MKKKVEITELNVIGRLFDVKYVDGTTYLVKVNPDIIHWVGEDVKDFESYLRKSFRNFYNLDKNLKKNKRPGTLKINKPQYMSKRQEDRILLCG